MKNIKDNKGITNMALITIVLVIIILMLLVAVIYLVKNPNTTYITQNIPTEQSQSSSAEIENAKETIKDNVQISDATSNVVKNEHKKISSDKFFKDVDEAYISKNLKLLSNDKSYSVTYVLKGKDSGKIIIKEENKVISEEKVDKEVVDMYSVYVNIYLLLEDGTIDKLSLEENDYKLKVLNGYNNIVRIQEVLVGNDEGDGIILAYNLVAIDTNGEVKYITVTAD